MTTAIDDSARLITEQTSAGSVTISGIRTATLRALPLLATILVLAVHLWVPNKNTFAATKTYPTALALIGSVLLVSWFGAFKWQRLGQWLTRQWPLLVASLVAVEVYDLLTQKFGLLLLPYFPGPDRILFLLIHDLPLIGMSTLYSLRLLFSGYLIGALLGVVTGVSIGWNSRCHYWLMPLLKVIGPIPATAWTPIALVVFPSSFWASVFLLVLSVWFPVSVMTSSGIANVRNAYFEVARTLGADERYLIFRVAIPAAFPMIFIGLFMGLGASFLTLIVAEMLGVKAGLGWYISWAQGWAEYGKVYAVLIVIAVIFSSLISIMFAVRDRVLVWQKGVIKW